MKAIFLSFYYKVAREHSGGQSGSEKNFRLLENYYGKDNVEWLTVEPKQGNIVTRLIDIVIGRRFEPSKQLQKHLISLIKQGIDVLFYDYANGGRFLKYIKKNYPSVKIIKFFHDVDLVRLKGQYKLLPLFRVRGQSKAKHWFYMKEIEKSSKLSVKFSDKIGALHSRDGLLIENIYGRKVDFYLPVTFENINELECNNNVYATNNNILFVAVMAYFPNIEGMRWFKPAMQKIKGHLHIVGRGSDKFKQELQEDNIHVHGEVDDLSIYYKAADLVIVPLLSGGGMKVKVCEAMNYGKYIFGTDEAFAGYDIDFNKIGGLCNTTDEFVEKINAHFEKNLGKINKYSKQVFVEKYTTNALNDIIANVIDNIK